MRGDVVGLVAALEERFLVPVCTSRHARRWVAGHRALSWPLLLRGGDVAWYAAPSGAGSVRVATVGRTKRFDGWLARLGATLGPAFAVPRRMSVREPAALDRLDADLVLAHVHRWAAESFRRAGWHTVPSAVRWQADLAEVPPSRPCRSLRSDLNLIERHGYVHEVGTAASDWDEFFGVMVEPEARARFAARAWIPSPYLRRDFAARGTLHFVRLDGVRVAGCCTVPTADGVWMPVNGVRDGDPRLLAKGAGSAALAATLRWARESGFRRIDLGRTTPFLDDGVARVKEKWGFCPVAEPLAHLIAVRAHPRCAPALELLRRHPVRIETAAGLDTFGARDAAR
jgi:hypothetical protein